MNKIPGGGFNFAVKGQYSQTVKGKRTPVKKFKKVDYPVSPLVPAIFKPNPTKHDPNFKTICFENGRLEVIRKIAFDLGFHEVTEHEFSNILWTNNPITVEKAGEMRRNLDTLQRQPRRYSANYLQKANHFPGMSEICRKDRLAANLNRMKKIFPEDYDYYPKTWTLPSDWGDLNRFAKEHGKDATYICKPDSGSQGRGIFLVRNLKKVDPTARMICQKYISKPFLIDGYKFDLRIYVLITSCDPLRIYIYNEGIARFATVKYSRPTDHNVDVVYMHLTNYSLNKFSHTYVPGNENGSKRKMSNVYKWLVLNDYDIFSLIDSIDELVIKTMIAIQPTLRHYYRTSFPKQDRGSSCFEILGFDILLDYRMKPYLLEVNHSPSFNLDLPVDEEIKVPLLRDTLGIIYLGSKIDYFKKKNHIPCSPTPTENLRLLEESELPKAIKNQFEFEMKNSGKFRLIYPCEDSAKYEKFYNQTKCPTMENSTAAAIIAQSPRLRKLFENSKTEEGTSASKNKSLIIKSKTSSTRKLRKGPSISKPASKAKNSIQDSSTKQNQIFSNKETKVIFSKLKNLAEPAVAISTKNKRAPPLPPLLQLPPLERDIRNEPISDYNKRFANLINEKYAGLNLDIEKKDFSDMFNNNISFSRSRIEKEEENLNDDDVLIQKIQRDLNELKRRNFLKGLKNAKGIVDVEKDREKDNDLPLFPDTTKYANQAMAAVRAMMHPESPTESNTIFSSSNNKNKSKVVRGQEWFLEPSQRESGTTNRRCSLYDFQYDENSVCTSEAVETEDSEYEEEEEEEESDINNNHLTTKISSRIAELAKAHVKAKLGEKKEMDIKSKEETENERLWRKIDNRIQANLKTCGIGIGGKPLKSRTTTKKIFNNKTFVWE